jgi:hypothetical protein
MDGKEIPNNNCFDFSGFRGEISSTMATRSVNGRSRQFCCDVAEMLVLYSVPFRGARRIVADAKYETRLIGQLL